MRFCELLCFLFIPLTPSHANTFLSLSLSLTHFRNIKLKI